MIVLIGGHPKGHKEAFSSETLSGKRLRGLVKDCGLQNKVAYLDLWGNSKQEHMGYISQRRRKALNDMLDKGYVMVALGRHVESCLSQAGYDFRYLPHPAVRSRKHYLDLLGGLVWLAENSPPDANDKIAEMLAESRARSMHIIWAMPSGGLS